MKSLLSILLCCMLNNVSAQWTSPTVDGVINAFEYGQHTYGQNQSYSTGTVYMNWDNTNLYIASQGLPVTSSFIIYIDKDNFNPVNANTRGILIGQPYSGTNMSSLPFGADLVISVDANNQEYRLPNGGGGTWSAPMTNGLFYADNGSNVKEISIPWSVIGGRPASFNFIMYTLNNGLPSGNIYDPYPGTNPGGNMGMNGHFERYYTVTSTNNDATYTMPFSRECYVFNNTSDETNFGALSVYNFTMNSNFRIERSINGGDWNISGNFYANNGQIDFGPNTNPPAVYGSTVINNLNIYSGVVNMNYTYSPLNITGSIIQSNGTLRLGQTGGGDLNLAGDYQILNTGLFFCSNRRVTLNGTNTQNFGTNLKTLTVDYLTIANTTNPVSVGNIIIDGSTPYNALEVYAGAQLNLSNTTINNTCKGYIAGKLSAGGLNANAPNVQVWNGGTFEHGADGGTIPTFSWLTGSNCLVDNFSTAKTLGGLNQTFYNLTWNCPVQKSIVNFGSNLQNIQGDFNVISTGSGTGGIGVGTGAISLATDAGVTINIAGNYNQTGGVVYIANGLGIPTINISKSFYIGIGTLDFNPNKPSGAIINVGTSFTGASGTLTHSGSGSNGNFHFNGTSAQYISSGLTSNFIDYTLMSGSTGIITTNFLYNSGTFNNYGTLLYQPGTAVTLGSHLHLYPGSTADFNNDTKPFTINGTLKIENTAKLILSTLSGGDLVLNGDWTNIGIFTANNSAVIFNNSSSDQIFSGEVPTTFNILTVNKIGKTLFFGNTSSGNKIHYLTNALNPISGFIDLNHNNLTLRSTAAQTASITAIGTANGVINGDAIIAERYFPAHRCWRLVSVPLNSQQFVKAAWQEGQTNTDLITLNNTNPGYGTHISGPQPGLGFDYTPLNHYGMKTYNPAGDNFVGIPNTNATKMNYANVYMLFVRGSRAANFNPYGPSDPTVLRTTGTLRQGDQINNFNVPTNQFTVISNPYPCSIDFHMLTRTGTGMSDKFSVWDPGMTGTYGVGAFVTFTRTGATYSAAPIPVSTGIGQYIQSGQAFFVQGTGNPATITISESHKVLNTYSTVFQKIETNISQLRIDLKIKNADSSFTLEDGTLVIYGPEYNNGLDNTDARKMNNLRETICLTRDTNSFAIEARKPITSNDTLFLNINTYLASYIFSIAPQNLTAPGLTAVLQDSYLKTETPISLTDTTKCSFTVTKDVATQSGDRFRIVFRKPPPPPINFNSLNATKLIDLIRVQWKIESKQNIKEYEVMRSSDGINFNSIATTPARISNTIYYHLDKDPITGTNYYKIKCVDSIGEITYSNIVKVDYSRDNQNVTVFPNPVLNGDLNILFKKLEKGIYQIALTNSGGQIVTRRIIQNSKEGNGMITIHQKSNPGKYRLDIKSPSNQIFQTGVIY